MKNTLHIELLLPATPAQVMSLLTDEKEIRIWSGEAAVFEAVEGGKVSLFDGWMNGIVQKVSAKELSYTCTTADLPEGTPDSLVHIELKAEDGQTRVSLLHSNLPCEEEAAQHKSGWYDFFFTPLEDYLMVRFNKD